MTKRPTRYQVVCNGRYAASLRKTFATRAEALRSCKWFERHYRGMVFHVAAVRRATR